MTKAPNTPTISDLLLKATTSGTFHAKPLVGSPQRNIPFGRPRDFIISSTIRADRLKEYALNIEHRLLLATLSKD
jgi:hypothetical protein